MKLFKYSFPLVFLYKSNLNKSFDQSLTDLFLIDHLINYRANRAHENKDIYGLFKEFKILTKLSKYCLYSTCISLYIHFNIIYKEIALF